MPVGKSSVSTYIYTQPKRGHGRWKIDQVMTSPIQDPFGWLSTAEGHTWKAVQFVWLVCDCCYSIMYLVPIIELSFLIPNPILGPVCPACVSLQYLFIFVHFSVHFSFPFGPVNLFDPVFTLSVTVSPDFVTVVTDCCVSFYTCWYCHC